MSKIDSEVVAVEWLNGLTDRQSRALGHQVGIAGSVTFPIEKLRKRLKERKILKMVMRVREKNNVIV